VSDANLESRRSRIRFRGDFHAAAEILAVLHGAEIGFFKFVLDTVYGYRHCERFEFGHGLKGVFKIGQFVLFAVFIDIIADSRIDTESAAVDETGWFYIRFGIANGDGTIANQF